MDYETKPTSRDDLRRYSVYFRKLFDVPETGPFPVLGMKPKQLIETYHVSKAFAAKRRKLDKKER